MMYFLLSGNKNETIYFHGSHSYRVRCTIEQTRRKEGKFRSECNMNRLVGQSTEVKIALWFRIPPRPVFVCLWVGVSLCR